MRAHGEVVGAHLVPLTVYGLIFASSMVLLDSAHCRTAVPALARWLLPPHVVLKRRDEAEAVTLVFALIAVSLN